MRRGRLAAIVGVTLLVTAPLGAEEAVSPDLSPVWQSAILQHQAAAHTIHLREGFAYSAGGGAQGRISKIRLADGRVIWTVPGDTYHPSYPVGNGHVVVYGRFYSSEIVALDEDTGKRLWAVPTGDQNMSAARFAGDLVVLGSYDRKVHAVEWATGKVRWTTTLGHRIWSRPAVHGDLLLIGCQDGNLHVLRRETGERVGVIDCGGSVQSDPIVVGDFAVLLAHDQRDDTPHDSSKVDKWLVVVDLRTRKTVLRLPTPTRWWKFVVVDGIVYASDRRRLVAVDPGRKLVLWARDAPEGLHPQPVIRGDAILLPFNDHPLDCFRPPDRERHPRNRVAVLDRASGKLRKIHETGGIEARQGRHAVDGDMLVTTERYLAGYRLPPLENR